MATTGDYRARFAAAFEKATTFEKSTEEETLNEAAVSRDDVIKQFKSLKNKNGKALFDAAELKKLNTFFDKLPPREPSFAAYQFLLPLSYDDKKYFMDQLGKTAAPTKNFGISKGFDTDLFHVDAKGIGKGEIYCAWKFKDAEIQGGGESFDVAVGATKYEVKDYSGTGFTKKGEGVVNNGAIRIGVEGSVSKFNFWKEILKTVNIIEKIQTGKDTWTLLPESPELSQLLELKDHILNRVQKEVKIVTGEFNKTDAKKFTQFYEAANRVVTNYETSGEFNQMVLQGKSGQRSIVIEPISTSDIPASGKMEITVKDSSGQATVETLINYLLKLEYLRNPSKFELDLNQAVADIIAEGQADYWMVFRGSQNNILGKIVSKDRNSEFLYDTISQNGIKFKEPI
ncbi:hypothetical protein N9P49_00460 [bacterium]|nr:hypothetical protein [bacterium]